MRGAGAGGVGRRSKEVGRGCTGAGERGLVAPSEVGSGELVARSQMLGVSLR